MSSGTEIIQEALEEIGAHSVFNNAEPEAIEKGRKRLNSMLQEWLSNDIDLGVPPLKVSGDELGEPLDARDAIIFQLSLRLAPSFNATPSFELKAAAINAYDFVESKYRVHEVPKKTLSSTTPMGEGNTVSRYSDTFAGEGRELDA